MMYVIIHVPQFFATALADATTYPDDVLRAFSITSRPWHPQAGRRHHARRVSRAGEPGDPTRAQPGRHLAERGHAAGGHARSFLDVLAAARQPEAPTEGQIAELLVRHPMILFVKRQLVDLGRGGAPMRCARRRVRSTYPCETPIYGRCSVSRNLRACRR